jgi:hypothetical protein
MKYIAMRPMPRRPPRRHSLVFTNLLPIEVLLDQVGDEG